MAELVFTILGCGSSGGVPRIGGHWGACDPDNPKNRRRRCSLLVQRFDAGGETTVLIDSSPDMREQLLDAGVGRLDAVVYTHEHADHMHGLDDLRMIVINMRDILPVYANKATQEALITRFGYAFKTPEGSPYPPILKMHDISAPLVVDGAGGAIELKPFDVPHGAFTTTCFRIDDVAYAPDISEFPHSSEMHVEGLDCWILDALRYAPHPSHINVETALELIETHKPRRAILTNLHMDIDYQTLCDETPSYVTAAYDGLQLRYDV